MSKKTFSFSRVLRVFQSLHMSKPGPSMRELHIDYNIDCHRTFYRDLDMCIQVRNVRSKASDISRTPLGAATLLIRPHNLIYTPKLAYYQVLLQHLNTLYGPEFTINFPRSILALIKLTMIQ